jgi:hypothetical protein
MAVYGGYLDTGFGKPQSMEAGMETALLLTDYIYIHSLN